MKTIRLGKSHLEAPVVVVGAMRLGSLSKDELTRFIHRALELGVNHFDHADIYGGGECEAHFGEAISADGSIKREDLIIQSKLGIRHGFYDFSKDYILSSVDAILSRLRTDYLDVLLLHRPDALVEPEEVAEAFDILEQAGKVRHFGVSNHKPMQVELLKTAVEQPLLVNQLQFSLAVANMVANGLEVNMDTDGATDRDGSVLDYSRIHRMTIQAWSPFQSANWQGVFLGDRARFAKLNDEIDAVAELHHTTPTTVAAAWILRHPAKMQVVAGTSRIERLEEIAQATDVELSREEWYRLYLCAGHPLP